tara:strand:+ start:376 stop:1053 length:678 start_codon:yes stop_codon:yes gene_type:complete
MIKQKKHIQYNFKKKHGLEKLGLMSNKRWIEDPRGLLFSLSRYKFVSKMLEGKKNVLEVGCGDGWFSRVVKQTVKNLTLSDSDKIFIQDAKKRKKGRWKFSYMIHDMTKNSTRLKYDGIYLLDVFEHIEKENEKKFIKNIIYSLSKNGVVIIGVPSLEFQKYVKNPDPTHVNCKTSDQLKKFLSRFFNNTFFFSMNDETVHTGFKRMANYFIVVCTEPKITNEKK